jgi:hypothetical protein
MRSKSPASAADSAVDWRPSVEMTDLSRAATLRRLAGVIIKSADLTVMRNAIVRYQSMLPAPGHFDQGKGTKIWEEPSPSIQAGV